MRLRSLVVSWCVCAIHGSVQTALEYRSRSETPRRFESQPFVETFHGVVREHSPKSVLEAFPVFQPHPVSMISEGVFLKVPTAADTSYGELSRKHADGYEKRLINRLVAKHGSRRKRRRKCKCRRKKSMDRRIKNDLVDTIDGEFAMENPLMFTNTVLIPDPSSEMPKTAIESSIMPVNNPNIIYDVPSIINVMTNRTNYAKGATDRINGEQMYEHDLFSCRGCKRVKRTRKKCIKREKKPVIDSFEYRLF